MILSEIVDILIIPKILKYYLIRGYDAKCGKILSVNIKDLPLKSMVNIKVKCDVCGKEKYLKYQKYTKNISTYGYYSCSQKCSIDKHKKTCLKKYGVDYYVNINKRKSTCLDRYGKSSYFETDDFKKQFEKTSIEKYGETYPMKSQLIKNKLKKSLMDIYGVENCMFLDEIKQKIKDSKITHKIISPDELVPLLRLYKRIVKNITYKNRKKLFEDWDGYDYYDGEFIKNNVTLTPTHRLYPTIDHKISTLYGFLNNIPPEIIGDMFNLCITKKCINSIKKEKIEESFDVNKFNI